MTKAGPHVNETDPRGVVSTYPALARADTHAAAGRLDEAAQCVMEHLRRHPDEPRGLAKLGEYAMQLGGLGQAERFLRRAILRGANDFGVRYNLASALNQQERLDEARVMFEALAVESDDPMIRGLHALTLEKLGRNDEARTILENLIERHGDRPHYWVSYGHNLRAAGRVADAIAAYRRATEVDPGCGEAWWGLASIKSRVFTDADIDRMRAALDAPTGEDDGARLHFALARAFHDRKRYAEAFDHYREANRQRAESIGYDAKELTEEIAELERVVTRDFIAALPDAPPGDDVPVFIVSLPRSGSTLLEQMLGSHGDIEPVGELAYAPAILRSVMEMATRR
jgi:Flp pilus assembly protein TadD